MTTKTGDDANKQKQENGALDFEIESDHQDACSKGDLEEDCGSFCDEVGNHNVKSSDSGDKGAVKGALFAVSDHGDATRAESNQVDNSEEEKQD